MSESRLVKIEIPLPRSDEYSYETETVWAEPVGEQNYKIRNTPFYARELSFEDIVNVDRGPDGTLVLRSVTQRGGHSTYRIFLEEGVSLEDPRFLEYWAPLEARGCSYEGATPRLYAVDVPPDADIYEVYDLLAAGREAQVWDLQEGHCGHALKD